MLRFLDTSSGTSVSRICSLHYTLQNILEYSDSKYYLICNQGVRGSSPLVGTIYLFEIKQLYFSGTARMDDEIVEG